MNRHQMLILEIDEKINELNQRLAGEYDSLTIGYLMDELEKYSFRRRKLIEKVYNVLVARDQPWVNEVLCEHEKNDLSIGMLEDEIAGIGVTRTLNQED